MKISLSETAVLLASKDNILILCHRRPDGDTIGSGFALYYALKSMGKNVRVECSDPFPEKFSYLYTGYNPTEFTEDFVVTVDVADVKLLGELGKIYYDKVDLCIDHHKSNTFFGAATYLDVTAPANTEIIYLLIKKMGISFTPAIADSLYTGLITDTGGFRFASVTPRTHMVASKLIRAGADHGEINRIVFESTSRGRLKVEAFARETMEYYLGDRCALLYIPTSVLTENGLEDDEIDGISSLPRMIEGIEVGITIREDVGDSFRISLRSRAPFDSSLVCGKFGGGGHANAAGCSMRGSLDSVKTKLLAEVEEQFKQVSNA